MQARPKLESTARFQKFNLMKEKPAFNLNLVCAEPAHCTPYDEILVQQFEHVEQDVEVRAGAAVN